MTTTAPSESIWRSEVVRTIPVVACWGLSRLAVLSVAVTTVGRLRRSLMGDVRLYRLWAHQLAHRGVRASDHRWQYPAGAALVFRGIGAVSGYFPLAFVVAMTACDALILVLLLTTPGRRGIHGAWYWVAALPLLGPISWFRFDLVPTACAVAAVRFGARRWLAGALIGLGIGVKLWPMGLLAGLPRRAYVAVVPAVLVGTALALNPWGDPTLFLHNQDSRGLQVESVLATPWIIGQALGRPMHHASSFGSQQLLIATRGISALSIATTIAGLLAIQLAVRRTSWPAAWPAAVFCSSWS